jgi:hypothetical protein
LAADPPRAQTASRFKAQTNPLSLAAGLVRFLRSPARTAPLPLPPRGRGVPGRAVRGILRFKAFLARPPPDARPGDPADEGTLLDRLEASLAPRGPTRTGSSSSIQSAKGPPDDEKAAGRAGPEALGMMRALRALTERRVRLIEEARRVKARPGPHTGPSSEGRESRGSGPPWAAE